MAFVPSYTSQQPSTSMSSDSTRLDGTYGALEIGVVVGSFLYGIETLQAFNYYRQFPKDSVLLKCTVAVIWFLDLAQTICTSNAIYLMTVTFYGRPPQEEISTPPRSLVLEILFAGVSSTMVQAFFANRIRIFSGTWYIMLLCYILMVPSLIGSLILMVLLSRSSSALSFLETQLHWEMIAFSSVGPAVDIIIATSMCFHLWRLRGSETQFKRMRSTLDTLILWTVETTLLTSFAAIIQIVLFLVRKDLSFMAFYIIQSKLFSNSMLAVLNGRTRFRSYDQRTGVSEPLAFELAASREDGNHSAFSVSISRNDGNQPSQMP
ncbi:hypothetical protein FB451DRAFT_1285015 [Mycena latifolia]|nr:hypothetical protein FB451DRAFT_1285015 [Mycena latifolia]